MRGGNIPTKSNSGEDTCTNSTNPEDTHELPTYNHENPIDENERTLFPGPKEIDTLSGIDAKNEAFHKRTLCESLLQYGEPLTNAKTL